MFLSFMAAFGLSALMAYVYKSSTGDDYEPDIAQSQILLACIMALVLMVVGDSISRAFGAVGILSVIRFRSNVKNSAEAATLLSAVAVGMACGVGMFRLAVAGALFLSLVQVLLRTIFEPSDRPPQPDGGKKRKKINTGLIEGEDLPTEGASPGP
jgi:O-antigen/teichoic acid export membrane protein